YCTRALHSVGVPQWKYANVARTVLGSTHLLACSHQHTDLSQHQLRPGRELSLQALLDMGFTDNQVDQLLEAATKRRGGQSEHASSIPMALMALFSSSVLEKCPELFYVKGTQLQQRMDNMRRLGLLEGNLQRVVSHYPQILTLPLRRVNTVARFLREKCAFTDDLGELEYKFQYTYFRMGLKQTEMVKSKLFWVTMAGQYQTHVKNGQTLIINPKLNDILAIAEETYLTDIAMATLEKFEVFQKLMAIEWQEEDDEQEREKRTNSDDDDDDDEEGYIKSCYRRRRKR
uniref:Mitochondrial transcription termination factor 4 n=1 Tax=Salmo trutta TaxID=8032 RepID=A0A673YQ69_SALTR